jgi:hypothetical protein
MFEFGQGKNNVQVVVGNIFVFEKKLESIGAAQRKYMNHQAKFFLSELYQITYVSMYQIIGINASTIGIIWIQLF